MHASGLTPMVGRAEELEIIQRRWEKASCGEGQIVLLSGEAGVGKSRLTAAVLQALGRQRARGVALLLRTARRAESASAVHRALRTRQRNRPRGRLTNAPGQATTAARAIGSHRRHRSCGYRRADVDRRRERTRRAVGKPAPAEDADDGFDLALRPGPGRESNGSDAFRGLALGRPDVDRDARPDLRSGAGPAVAAHRDVPPRVFLAVDWPHQCDDDCVESVASA